MSDSLHLVSTELAAAVAAADERQKRAAVLAGVRLAASCTGLSDPRADQALSALDEGITGAPEERTAVRRLAEELDEEAFQVRDQVELGDTPYEAYREVFRKARAASALDFAFEPDAARAASESLYEANSAIQDLDALRGAVDAALG